MPIQGIDTARENLRKASNSYADIQRQLDRYNKVFETYANASPETQMRAASVMRQALNEYNWLKKQQQDNTIKIYEAQNWIKYYNNNNQPVTVEPTQLHAIAPNQVQYPIEDMTMARPAQQSPIISTSTPWTLNNNTPTTSAEFNAVDTNQTMNVSNPVFTNLNNQSTVKPTTPVWVTRIINSQTPQYSNTTIWPVPVTYKPTATYWPGTNVGINSGSALLTTNTTFPNRNNMFSSLTWRKRNLSRARK